MGESLFYSWLRHVKECQIVQTNWTNSNQWDLLHEDELEDIKSRTESFFAEKYSYDIFKKTASLSQLLTQAECDAIGLSIQDGINKIYAVDVAFHESGLNYGGTEGTVQRIVKKCLRTAMCVYGYLDSKEAEIIFASPKIGQAVLDKLLPCVNDMQNVMNDHGFCFRFRVFANSDFRDKVLDPILKVSGGVTDTNELFMRSYQMLQMYSKPHTQGDAAKNPDDAYAELKIGKVVNLVLRPLLEAGLISDEEISRLQDKEYSNKIFGLHFPLLVPVDGEYEKVRYYKDSVRISGVEYKLCSQWAEGKSRAQLMEFIETHDKKMNSTLEAFIREHNLSEVDFLGEVSGHKYYIEKMPDDEDIGEPTVIMDYGQEPYICNSDEMWAVIGMFSGNANIDMSDPQSIGAWKRVFNVTETDLLKAVDAVGVSAMAVKEYLAKKGDA